MDVQVVGGDKHASLLHFDTTYSGEKFYSQDHSSFFFNETIFFQTKWETAALSKMYSRFFHLKKFNLQEILANLIQ